MMGSAGGGNEDPVLAVMRVLGDPATYVAKYEDLVKQTVASQQATETAIKERNAADATIAKAAADSADLARAIATFNDTTAAQNSVFCLRNGGISKRESDCDARETALTIREAALTAATTKAMADIESARASAAANAAKQCFDIEQRRTAINVDYAETQQKLETRCAAIAEREAAAERLNSAVAALKLDYEQRLAKLRAIAEGSQ